MPNQGYAHVNSVQAQVIDMSGDVTQGGQALYSAVVLDANNNPVSYVPGAPNFYVSNRPVTFSVLQAFNLQKVQAAITTDLLNLYNDQTIQVTFL